MDSHALRISRNSTLKIASSTTLITLLSAAAFAEPEGLTDLYGSAETISLATGYEQPLFEAPATATIVDRSEIQRLGSTTLTEVLEQLAGIKVSTQDGRGTQVAVRGTTSNVLILVNNLQTTNGLIHAYQTLDNVLLNDVERIEVVRGARSARYGADASSAVINIVTRSGLHARGFEATVKAGSLDTYEGSLIFRQFYGDTHLGVSLQGRTTDFNDEIVGGDAQTAIDRVFRTHASNAPGPINAHRDVIEARVDVSKGPFRARANYLNQYNFHTATGLSWALDPEGTYDSEYVTADFTYQDSLTPSLDLMAYILGVNIDQAARNLRLFPQGAFGGAFPDGVLLEVDATEQRIRTETVVTYRGLTQHTLHFGGGAFEEDFAIQGDRRNWTVRAGRIIPTGTYGEGAGINDTTFLNDTTTTAVYSFVQDAWRFRPDWNLTVGVRMDDYTRYGPTVNPRGALVWSVNPTLALKLIYGRAFEPPSLTNTQSNGVLIARGDPDLKPQTTDMIEIAATHRTLTSVISASTFYYKEQRLIQSVPSAQSPNGLQFVNRGDRQGWGFELDGRWEMPKGILGFNYGYQKPDGDNVSDDTMLRYPPQHDINANFTYFISDRVNATVVASHIAGRERPSSDPRQALKDYSLLKLGFTWDTPFRGVELNVWVKNLLDEKYSVASSTMALPGDIPQPGRTVYMGFQVQY